jgi:hypothetical protein
MASPEQDPKMSIHIDGDTYEARPYNTRLYTFAGELASRNHVFIGTGQREEDGQTIASGTYIFELLAKQQQYKQLTTYMLRNHYPMELNQLEVQPCDEDAFQAAVDKTVTGEPVPDTIPNGWD